eukprot:48337-Eustigmatos_ZCMA.PRE.1
MKRWTPYIADEYDGSSYAPPTSVARTVDNQHLKGPQHREGLPSRCNRRYRRGSSEEAPTGTM